MSQQQEIIAALPSNATIQESSPKSPSSHSQYQSQIENLKRLPVPYSEIYHVLSSYETIPIKLLSSKIRNAATDLTVWLETAKLAVLGLEVEVKQEDASGKQDVNEIDMIMHRFYPNIEMMTELKDKVGSRLDTPEESQYQQSIGDGEAEEPSLTSQELQLAAKTIQSNWILLKTMLDEVKGIFASSQTRRGLLTQMEDVLAEIEEIGLGMDRFQEERFYQNPELSRSGSAQIPSSPSLSPSTTSTDPNTTNSEDAQEKQRNTEALASLDGRIGSLGTRIEMLTVQIDALPPDDVKHEELQEQYQELLDLWDDTRAHRDRIGDELKEERWLAVFEQVAGQVESMMESMDRAIIHCKGMVDQIFTMVRDRVVPAAPIDRDHLYTTFKSFEAKHKYYAPAVNKMLNMLQNGIESRATKNTEVIQKHRAMMARWEELRDSLDRVELDLDGIEEMLDILDASIPSNLPTPPMQLPEKPLFAMRRSQPQAEWVSPGPAALFHPPQQSQQPQRGRRPLPSSGSLQSPMYSPKDAPAMTRNRSPISSRPRHRPWSPVPSIASPPSLLSPNTYSNYRALSPSPSRSPSRAMSDKLRPWCPRYFVRSLVFMVPCSVQIPCSFKLTPIRIM
ncbi:hypothetical protein EDD21DRAFT_164582 [Dissophora ornata]|nr:hypothetical protein EDD21DRAFT_164582 [Dissophora ornata]